MPDNVKRNLLIAKITSAILERSNSDEGLLLKPFITQYLNLLSYTDLREQSVMDMAGLIMAHWKLIQHRKKGEAKVRVYNPTYDKDGWQSPHTVIEISHDDMPFLVDSTRMEIDRNKLGIHFIIHVGGMKLRRDIDGKIIEVLPWGTKEQNCDSEAPIHIEIDKSTDERFLQELQQNLERVLNDVGVAVSDWHAMREQVNDSIKNLEENPPALDSAEVRESIDFLHWLEDNNFTFLGSRDYELIGAVGERALKMVPLSGLGVLRDTSKSLKFRNFSDMTPEAINLMLSPQALIIAKTNTQSSVHRPVFTDYIGVKRFDENGNLIGERRFIGLFTSTAYSSSVRNIPYFRLKTAKIMDGSGLIKNSHARKALLNILEHFPRNDLFQGGIEELQEIAMGIFNLQERKRVRLFIRRDIYGRYMSCYVYIPKYRFTDELRRTIQGVLENSFHGKVREYDTYFSDSTLARLHYVIRTDPLEKPEYDATVIEQQIITVATLWRDNLHQVLLDFYGEEKGLELRNIYDHAFPAGYRERNTPSVAVTDVKYLEQLSRSTPMILNLYRSNDAKGNNFDFKVYQLNNSVPLSDVMPILENMGMRVVGEHPYEVRRPDGLSIWINDFHMEFTQAAPINMSSIKAKFQQAFAKVWFSTLENDGFNKLILLAQLDWQQVTLLRALAKYIKQIGMTYSQPYIETSFIHYPKIARMLIELFNKRFDPEVTEQAIMDLTNLQTRINKALDEVVSLDEDRIIRLYLNLILAMTRTNYFQIKNNLPKAYLSFKFNPSLIPLLPLPKPAYEIFVYSPQFEGVHLRCGKVARGGIRWSDRQEDFRTEILGLMKAQQVKNSVIVPNGAKGGFFVKSLKKFHSRDERSKEAKTCYKNFIRGLLDLTDNIEHNEMKKPENTICYDGEDSYLVVAADKGTATFSDTANDISKEYRFWLDDAFASGGRTGYDHKKMGITARGTWISVQRHFRTLNISINDTDFTVVGIGDMSGDVFGNGMLLSEHIKLVAVFNHQHIFIDPNPDVLISFQERKRLFSMPRSTWEDYDKEKISSGGGVYSRSLKTIKLTRQVKKLLNLTQDHIVPDDLIKAILRANVDLLWNGGIGTYVKASHQSNNDVGDRANDNVRVNAKELRCKVVAEGGNLGLTQAGRIEYALNKGAIYTDFIDNSAGVDCSDKEVNIKILLDKVVEKDIIDFNQRNELLRDMTTDVADIVLGDNYRQTQAIELAMAQAHKQVDLYSRFVQLLVEKQILKRELESLPNVEVLLERKAKGQGLTAPEISVVISYSKIFLQTRLLDSDVPEDPWLARYLFTAFPKRLLTRFNKELEDHRLRREIITTQLSNDLVNEMGAVFIYRMYHETGATYTDIVRAYVAAREIFNLPGLFREIEALDYKVSTQIQAKMLLLVSKLVRRSSRWLIHHYRENLDIGAIINTYKNDVESLYKDLPTEIHGERREFYIDMLEMLTDQHVPKNLAQRIAICDVMFCALDIVEEATSMNLSFRKFVKTYLEIGQELNLSWLRHQIRYQKNETHWEGLALAGIFDDIDAVQRQLTSSIINSSGKSLTVKKQVKNWCEKYTRMISRWQKMITSIKNSKSISPVMLFVGLRELTDLVQTCTREQKE